jgi:biopolymer transport protein ExbD
LSPTQAIAPLVVSHGMANLDVGGHSERREVNRDIPLVPFIDFLLCIVAFLLVTAVWSETARVEASALVPGDAVGPSAPPVPELDVDMRHGGNFHLSWRLGNVVLNEAEAPRPAIPDREAAVTYPDLAKQVVAEWGRRGSHRAETDRARDRAVLHAGNAAPFEEIVAAMDAIHAAEKTVGRRSVPAFDVVFAVD